MAEWREVYLDWFHRIAEPYWRYWAERRVAIATPEQWHAHRNYLKAVFLDAVGGLPAHRTPLNARSMGQLNMGDYVIERVVFESVPGMVVTANVYRPPSVSSPAPAVLVACGHAEVGKANERYRRLCTSLALKGYVVLTYDPIGQGERYMYVDDARRPLRGACTRQHTHLAVQLSSAALSLARFMIWDSMRAVDYLMTRPDVDADRIGMTGCSGGGTNTAYTAALDERIAAAMPVCYITSLEERQRSGQIADYEQNLYAQLERGLDHADYIAMVAPRPVCIGAATEDFFPLPGARESYAAARRIYQLLGVPERCEMVVVDGRHGYSPELRRAAYRFFNRWLGVDADDAEPDFDLPDEDDIRCLADGVPADATFRVALSAARDRAGQLAEHVLSGDDLRRELKLLVGHAPELVRVGQWSEAADGVEVAQVVPSGAPPVVVLRRAGAQVSRVAVAETEDAARRAVVAGDADAAVALPLAESPDLADRAALAKTAEPAARFPWTHSPESFCAFYAQLLGRDWPFIRAAQILGAVTALGRGPFAVTAAGLLCTPVLYAAALDRRIAELTLHGPLWSYADVLECEMHVLAPGEIPWGWAGSHDLPAVMALLAPRPLRMVDPRGADGRRLAEADLRDVDKIRTAYRQAGAPRAFSIDFTP